MTVLLRFLLLSSFMAISSGVHAEANYQNRPSPSTGYGTFNPNRPTSSVDGSQGRVSPSASASPKSCTYQGGPKSGLWSCR